ncbi:hypothetical protein F2P81_006798 [Scophthalmus maximus]|uniref:Protein preY, mitochondrial n=1 Tax=Scophthalmus maximus TaxID=52904 RepID=A0A6A4TAK7_SCOMX|nr:hypothetical protein F2P81_006798 [Scophthalmus maximus]
MRNENVEEKQLPTGKARTNQEVSFPSVSVTAVSVWASLKKAFWEIELVTQQVHDSLCYKELLTPPPPPPREMEEGAKRYEAKTNELINEELGIAYPITDGIPNMIPQDARLIQKDAPATQE